MQVHVLDKDGLACGDAGEGPERVRIACRDAPGKRVTGADVRCTAELERVVVAGPQIQRGKRDVVAVLLHDPAQVLAGRLRVARLARGGELAQELHSPRAHDLLGGLAADAQHPADDTFVVVDSAVREAEVRLLEVPRAHERQLLGRDPVGDAARHHLPDHRTYRVPRLGLGIADGSTEGVRVLRADEPDVCVVVELDQLRAPQKDHRIARAEDGPDDGVQASRPALHCSQRGLVPAELGDPPPHLAGLRRGPEASSRCPRLLVRLRPLVHRNIRLAERRSPRQPDRPEQPRRTLRRSDAHPRGPELW